MPAGPSGQILANPVCGVTFMTTTEPGKQLLHLVFGGELASMGFAAELYQHDPHIRAVLLPPWAMVPVSSDAVGP